MIKVSSSLPDIAVLRGGNVNFKNSLKEGVEVLTSLSKIGFAPLDVLIDKEGSWTAQGAPTDPHSIFTRAHTVIDTTKMKCEKYHELAKKMGVKLHFSSTHDFSTDRENVYRILRQHDVKVPETFVIRSSTPLKNEVFRDLWTRYHTPLLIRPLERHPSLNSRIVRVFTELENAVREYHSQGVDIHILTYRKAHVTSLAALPLFRGEEVYTSLWVDSFPEDGELPNSETQMRPHLQAPDFRKEHMKEMATKIFKAFGIKAPICIDFIHHNNDYVVVNIDFRPSLLKEGRFMRSLQTTGVDAGQYIHSVIHNELKG